MTSTKYPKGSAWKRKNWDKWGFWRRVLHILAVIASLFACVTMVLGTAYVILIIFGVYGYLDHIRDQILLALAHLILD